MVRILRRSASLIAMLTIAIIVIRGSDAFTANYQKVNLYGILGYELFEGHLGTPVRPRLDIAVISLAAIVACSALIWIARRGVASAAVVVWVVFVGLSFSAATWTLRPWLDIFEQSSAAAAPYILEAGQVAVVIDGPSAVRIESLTSLLYRAQYPPVEVVAEGRCPSSEFVAASDSWLPAYPVEPVVDLVPFGGRLYRVACGP